MTGVLAFPEMVDSVGVYDTPIAIAGTNSVRVLLLSPHEKRETKIKERSQSKIPNPETVLISNI